MFMPRAALALAALASLAICGSAQAAGSQRSWGQGGLWVDPSAQLGGDFNGDGLMDVANAFADGNNEICIDVYLSTGSGFQPLQRWVTDQGGYISGMLFRAGDFDGDGRTDIAAIFPTDNGLVDIDVHRSLGSQANHGFAMARWATNQGGWVDGADWLVGHFNDDRFDDLAYIFNNDGIDGNGGADIDVHHSTGTQFVNERWATGQGGWIGLAIRDPQKVFLKYDDAHCVACARDAQWMSGDFNGDGLSDLGLAFNDGGLIDLDVHLSNGRAFVWQRASTKNGGWVSECYWTSGDFDGDGRAEMVNMFDSIVPNGVLGAHIDMHYSTIPYGAFALTGENFTLRRWATGVGTKFWEPLHDRHYGWMTGAVFGGGFMHHTSAGTDDIMIVYDSDESGAGNVVFDAVINTTTSTGPTPLPPIAPIPPCQPTTCAAAAKNCGTMPDGCGGTLSCGTCSASETCGGHVGNVCCAPLACADENAVCGSISDGCGHTVQCGGCAAGKVCAPNQQACIDAGCAQSSCSTGYAWVPNVCKCVKLTCDCGGVWPNCKTCS